MGTRVIALGQTVGGDDAAGLHVLDALRRNPLLRDQCFVARDASALLELLDTTDEVLICDAVIAEPTGEVLELDPKALSRTARAALSNHGLSVGQALELALVLGKYPPRVEVIGISIRAPRGHQTELSSTTRAAVSRATEHILSKLGATDA